jgi:LPXTG-motif cell wall-anchored protein
MVVTAAATSILSLYVTQAFADSHAEGAPGGSLGALSGTSAALYGGSGYGDDDSGASGYGDDDGGASDSGYGDDDGYGDDSGYGHDSDPPGSYGDTPAAQPPSTPPASPPATTPPVTSPPPATTPPTSVTTPSAPPSTQPPTLPETGGDGHAVVVSGLAALLLTGGTILYRRGRAEPPR